MTEKELLDKLRDVVYISDKKGKIASLPENPLNPISNECLGFIRELKGYGWIIQYSIE